MLQKSAFSVFLQERLNCNSCVQCILNKKYFLAVEKIHYLRGVTSGTSSKMCDIWAEFHTELGCCLISLHCNNGSSFSWTNWRKEKTAFQNLLYICFRLMLKSPACIFHSVYVHPQCTYPMSYDILRSIPMFYHILTIFYF